MYLHPRALFSPVYMQSRGCVKRNFARKMPGSTKTIVQTIPSGLRSFFLKIKKADLPKIGGPAWCHFFDGRAIVSG